MDFGAYLESPEEGPASHSKRVPTVEDGVTI
jgi:hypothetical protein